MRKRLGEILVAAGVIDEMQLKSALAEAARWGKRVGEVLVARTHCTDQQIMDALSSQLGVAKAALATTVLVPPRVLRLVTPQFARERQVLPLFLDARTGVLEVAVSDPASYELLDELRFRTGHEIRPLVATPRELEEAIEHFYFGRPRASVTGPPGPRPPGALEASGVSDPFVHGPDVSSFQPPAPAPGTTRPGITGPIGTEVTPPVSVVRRERILGEAPEPAIGPTLSSVGGTLGVSGEEIARLQARLVELETQVAEQQARLERIYGVLREAATAHKQLVAELADRALIDRAEYAKRVHDRLQGNEG